MNCPVEWGRVQALAVGEEGLRGVVEVLPVVCRVRDLLQHERLRRIPVAVLSADAAPAQIRRLTAYGAAAHLTKPFDIGHLMRLLYERLRATARQETDARQI